MPDELSVVHLLVQHAQTRLDLQGREIDRHENRVLAFIAFDVAAVALLTSLRDSLQPWWWILLIGFAASASSFAVPLWPRRFDTGPDLREFYQMWGGATAYDAYRQMLGELLDAVESNRKVMPQREVAST